MLGAVSTITSSPEDWKRVGDLVRQRRLELGLTIEEALDRATPKISRSVWSNLERGAQESYAEISLAGICSALQWSADSISKLLHGDPPTEFVRNEPASIDHRLTDIEREIFELKQLVQRLLDEPRA